MAPEVDPSRREQAEVERAQKIAALRTYTGFVIWLGIGLYTIFGWLLPHNFRFHSQHMETEMIFSSSVNTDPVMPKPGETTKITIALRGEDGLPLQDLKIEHERLVHMIIVSEDLNTFMHIHPDDFAPITDEMRAKGEYTLYAVFPRAGVYELATGFSHQGHEGTVRNTITVPGGKPEPVALTKNTLREQKFADFTVRLDTGLAQIQSGVPAHLEYTMTDADGKPVNNLVSYLGAPMHLAVWSYDLGYFLHTHGEVPGYGHEVPEGAAFGPLIDVHATFPYPGLYRAFAQFSRDGDVYTTTFDIQVAPGPEGVMMSGGGGHSH